MWCDSFKKCCKNFFKHLQFQENEKLVYKNQTFKNQEIIEKFIEREKIFREKEAKYVQIIQDQDEKLGNTNGNDQI